MTMGVRDDLPATNPQPCITIRLVTTIGILALQGDFIEHEVMLRRLETQTRQVRTAEGLRGLDGLIIPGGESTTFCRLMRDFCLYEPLFAYVRTGAPVWGTCAGMIVLARNAIGLDFPTLDAIDITVRRNAYGRQVESFEADIGVDGLGAGPFHAVFIRAPVVESAGTGVTVMAALPDEGRAGRSPVAVRQGHIIATSFHPELTDDTRFHAFFLDLVQAGGRHFSSK